MSCDVIKHTVKLEWEPEGEFVPVFTGKKLIFYHQDVLHNTKLIYGLWHSGHLCAHNTACINQVCVFMYAIPCTHASVCGQGAWNSPWRSFFTSKLLYMKLGLMKCDTFCMMLWKVICNKVKHKPNGTSGIRTHKGDRQYLCSLAPDPLLSFQLIDTGIPVISGHF